MLKRLVLATALATACAAVAGAEGIGSPSGLGQGNRALRGVYSISGTRACVYAVQNGFGPAPFYALLTAGPSSTRTAIVTGELRLNGDGTGAADFKLIQINNQLVSLGQQPMSVALQTCDLSYGDLPDGTLVLNTIGCSGPVTAGGGAGGFAGGGESALSVKATKDGSVLLLSGTEPVVEEVFFSPAPGVSFPSSRICGRSYTAILVSPLAGE